MAVAHSNSPCHLPSSPIPPSLSLAYTTNLSANMSFWNRKEKNLIPPVQPAQSEEAKRNELFGARGNSTSPRPPSNFSRSSSATYVASRDGDPYASAPLPQQNSYGGPAAGGDRYARQNAVGDVYSRGQANIDQDRNELFSGYRPPPGGGSGRFFDDGPRGGAGGGMGGRPGRRGTPPPGEEGEEDVEGIKQDLRYMKQDSVNSTRNALRLAREAEETARNTVSKLGSQSGESVVFVRALGRCRPPAPPPAGITRLWDAVLSARFAFLAFQRSSRTRSATWTCPRGTRCARRTRRTS